MNIPEVNRSVVVVRPKQPYIDWANSFRDGGSTLSLENAHRDASVYLVPEFEDEHQLKRVLETYFPVIFEHELWSWMTDETTWPTNRDFPTFKEWFHCEFHDLVVDLCLGGLTRKL